MQLEVFKVFCSAAACQSCSEKGEKARVNFTFWSGLSAGAEKENAHGALTFFGPTPEIAHSTIYMIYNMQCKSLHNQYGFSLNTEYIHLLKGMNL